MKGRQANGKFGKGNPGGPGRPSRKAEADYLRAMTDAVPVEAWRRIVARAALDAENGDARARDWLGRYLLASADAAATADEASCVTVFQLPANGREAVT